MAFFREKTHFAARQKRAIEHVKRNGSISRQEYMRINHVSHTIAHQELKELVNKEIFRKTGAGKYTRYELTQG